MNAIGIYRIGNWCHKKKIPIIPKVCFYINFLVFNSAIPSTCEIGEGTRFAYGAIGVVLHSNCKIGNNCMIGQNVTIGGKSGPNGGGVPTIGDNCYISAGARLIGNVKVEDNSVVGANAVVLKDVPSNCIVAGVPSKIIKRDINIKEYWPGSKE